MRVLVELQSTKQQPYQLEYHYPLQGFIYSLLRNSKFEKIHDKEGYKFFCFSNIFPAYDFKQGDTRYLLISSPDRDFVWHVASILREKKRSGEFVNIGSMQFVIKNVKIMEMKLRKPFTLITGTPIVIRIPKKKYEKFDVKPRYPYQYIYWRKEYPLELFIEQVENNLRKKYAEFNGSRVKRESIIQRLTFVKQVSTRVYIHDRAQVLIGSVWEFWFNNDVHRKLLEFGLDCGFGERNPLGFGFMNVK